MEFPHEVYELVEQLTQKIQQTLGENLVGIYPRGSLAYGDFKEDTSDLDILVVTEKVITEEEFEALSKMHERISRLPNQYAKEIEISYISKDNVRVFVENQKHPTLYRGESEKFAWQEHRANWILERWTVREYEKAYIGPNPKTLIARISEEDLIQAVCERLMDWAEWARDDHAPEWQLPNNLKVYFVETMCRAYYSIETGKLASKSDSVKWSLENLPPRWKEFVTQSCKWKGDDQIDLSVNQPLRSFVVWVANSSRCATYG